MQDKERRKAQKKGSKSMTRFEMMQNVANGIVTEEMQKIAQEIVQKELDRRAEKRSANDAVHTAILEVLEHCDVPVLAREIAEQINISPQKASSSLTAMFKAGQIKRFETVKGSKVERTYSL